MIVLMTLNELNMMYHNPNSRLPTTQVGESIELTQGGYDDVISQIMQGASASVPLLTAPDVTNAFEDADVLTNKVILLGFADPAAGFQTVAGASGFALGERTVGLNNEEATRGNQVSGAQLLNAFNNWPFNIVENRGLGWRVRHRIDNISSYQGGKYVVAELTTFGFSGNGADRSDAGAVATVAFQCVFQYVKDGQKHKLESLMFQVIEVPGEGAGLTYFESDGITIRDAFQHRYDTKQTV